MGKVVKDRFHDEERNPYLSDSDFGDEDSNDETTASEEHDEEQAPNPSTSSKPRKGPTLDSHFEKEVRWDDEDDLHNDVRSHTSSKSKEKTKMKIKHSGTYTSIRAVKDDEEDVTGSEDLLAVYGFDAESGADVLLTTMTESIYSIMYVSPSHYPSFMFAMFTFGFQSALIILIFLDLVDFDSDNMIQIPPGVNVEVQIAEALAMILAVATQEDMIVAVTKFIDGYKGNITKKFVHATKCKWLYSVVLQFSIGLFVLLDTFVVVAQSRTVIEMMLNFAGLTFVSEIDDIAFLLAKHGFFTDSMQKMCQCIENTPVPIEGMHNNTRRISYVVISAMLLAAFSKLTYDQLTGAMVCQNIFVQFGDGYSPALPFFSGVYQQSGKTYARRVSYVEKKDNPCAIFAYCAEEEVWTFSYDEMCRDKGAAGSQYNFDNHDPCVYDARSSPTSTYDILETLSSPWYVRDTLNSNIAFQFDWFRMTCNDCEVACSRQFGECIDDQCVCKPDRYGLNCEFRTPCNSLDLDLRTPPFETLGIGDVELSPKLKLLKDENDEIVEIYNRPVYYNEQPRDDDDYAFSNGGVNDTVYTIVMFLGRRWVATFGNTFDAQTNYEDTMGMMTSRFTAFNSTITKDHVYHFLANFHAFESDYTILYLSDPMDQGTPSDSSSPDRLNWYKAEYVDKLDTYKPDLSEPIGTLLLCTQCTEWNVCANFGKCVIPLKNEDNNLQNDDLVFLTNTQSSSNNNVNSNMLVFNEYNNNNNNDGAMVDIDAANAGDGQCNCFNGFGGALCELEYTCLEKRCLHGGKCNKLTGICQCPNKKISGKLCQFKTAN